MTAPSTPTPDAKLPRPTLRERLVQERREELIDAALTAFARRGYHATSLKEIAELAGVTDGLLIHYFGSKLNLLRAVLAERHWLMAEVERIVDEAPDDSAEAALRYVATRWLEALQGTGRPLMGMLISEARHNPEVAEVLATYSRRAVEPTERLLTRLAAAGHVAPDHIPIAARMLQWALVWYAFAHDVSPAYGLPEPSEWVEGLVAILLHGLLPRPS